MSLVDGDGEKVLSEIIVVVACLIMLKKEADRTRGKQAAMMSCGVCRVIHKLKRSLH